MAVRGVEWPGSCGSIGTVQFVTPQRIVPSPGAHLPPLPAKVVGPNTPCRRALSIALTAVSGRTSGPRPRDGGAELRERRRQGSRCPAVMRGTSGRVTPSRVRSGHPTSGDGTSPTPGVV
ncbi:hypothetical protein FRAAL2240 [Frankia alni ACN14a]|uniref:Uncharacterized protein n=1 Tax=Frankia alni (strain DSM 45986 / CECT 9034 / ACN14a) TaxID=326424 RepID=Q0RNJ9_FRAAA|nr:hypothetical protein FRAAL2240 [Frankia alni ACN14a]